MYVRQSTPRVGARQAQARLGELTSAARFAGRRAVLLQRGKPAAAIVSVEDLERLERTDAEHHTPQHQEPK